jgi:hypothetical protein
MVEIAARSVDILVDEVALGDPAPQALEDCTHARDRLGSGSA